MPVSKKPLELVENTEQDVGIVEGVKRDVTYTIEPSRAGFYSIKLSKGTVPKELVGLFSSIPRAFEQIKMYENSKTSQSRSAIRRDVEAEAQDA